MANNLPMSIGVESAQEILRALLATEKFLADTPDAVGIREYPLDVWAEGFIIGRVEVIDDVPNFIPNGDWFGTEVERMG